MIECWVEGGGKEGGGERRRGMKGRLKGEGGNVSGWFHNVQVKDACVMYA